MDEKRDVLVSMRKVCHDYHLSYTMIYRRIAKGEPRFPKAVKIGRTAYFRQTELQTYQDACEAMGKPLRRRILTPPAERFEILELDA